MELLAGDRQFPNPDDFPQHIAPFPDATDPLYPNPHPPDSNLPPQKLRPIRCGVISGTFDRGIGAGSSEVGFLPNHLCSVNRDGSEYFELAAEGEARSAAENGGVGLVAEDPVRFGSGAVGEEWNLMLKKRVLEDESSSSSDDNDDSSASVKEPGSRKRKRKSRKKLETFVESLVMKVMDKQEQMHNQLIAMLEKRERERIISEEAWKQQEMERMKRDEELRMQEISRSIALISFIRNVLGHEHETPQPLVSSWQKDMREEGGNTIGIEKDTRDDPSNRRWPEAEVKALMTLRTALERKIRVMGSKESIWEEIAVGLQAMGYSRSAKKCKEKWANMNKYYKQSVGSGKKPVSSPYYRELDILHKNGTVCPENASYIANEENECKENSKH